MPIVIKPLELDPFVWSCSHETCGSLLQQNSSNPQGGAFAGEVDAWHAVAEELCR
jgi:hypothetical protein